MKVGDYVRTNDRGIRRIGKIIDDSFYRDEEDNLHQKGNLIKSSPNIIDLIEVGDYVNGERVIYKQYKEYPNPLLDHYVVDTTRRSYSEIEIKSIVTKEQFESMEYRIGE